MATDAAALRQIIMRSDRSRFGASMLALVVVHVPLSLLAGSLSASGLLSLTALLVVHRVLIVRSVPRLPSATTLTFASYANSHTLRIVLLAPLFCVLSIMASFACHGQPLLACSPKLPSEDVSSDPADAPPCASPLALVSAAWSAAIGLVAAVQYLSTPSMQTMRWPLLQQDTYLRLRCHLRSIVGQAARTATVCAISFVLFKWANRRLLLAVGAKLLGPRCGECALEPLMMAGGLADGIWLLLRAGCYLICLNVALRVAAVSYTQPIDFSSAAPPGQTETDAALKIALEKHDAPLTQHLAFLDVFLLSEYSARRRGTLFAARHGSGMRSC